MVHENSLQQRVIVDEYQVTYLAGIHPLFHIKNQ